MTVIATMLAGLSSSEMTRAQYERSLAAQQQSKAGDQWGFFQAKRLRGALQHSTIDLLSATTELHPLDPAALQRSAAPGLDLPEARAAPAVLAGGELPSAGPAPAPDPRAHAALRALENPRTDAELSLLLAQVDDAVLAAALRAALEHTRAFDAALQPVNRLTDLLDVFFSEQAPPASGPAVLRRDFVAARLRYAARRYDAEARLNQAVANLYELQVRKSNLSAERHGRRSQRYFYGMLPRRPP